MQVLDHFMYDLRMVVAQRECSGAGQAVKVGLARGIFHYRALRSFDRDGEAPRIRANV